MNSSRVYEVRVIRLGASATDVTVRGLPPHLLVEGMIVAICGSRFRAAESRISVKVLIIQVDC